MIYNKSFLVIVIAAFALTLTSCKKEKDPEPTPTPTPTPTPVVKDCETNNYGIITVDFSSNLVAHSIIITYSGTTEFREKIIPIGTISDTIHLKPSDFTLSFASLNTLGQALESSNKSDSIVKCQEYTIGVSF